MRVIENAGFLALARERTPEGLTRIGSPKNVREFAHILYSSFREADHRGFQSLVISLPVGSGLALAIRERVLKASHQ